MPFDINSVQPYLPSNLTLNAYQQAGGIGSGYNTWLQNQLQSQANGTSFSPLYATFDPSYFNGRTFNNGQVAAPDANIGGGPSSAQYQDYSWKNNLDSITANQFGAPSATGANFGINSTANQASATNNTNSSNSATPGAISALASNQPNLKNRQPNLAAGWGGWNAGTNAGNGDLGSANFTYYSQFA